MPVVLGEAGIAEHEHRIGNIIHQCLKIRWRAVIYSSSVTSPTNNQAKMVQQHPQLTADNPALVGQPFAPDLLGGSPLAARMNQRDAIRIYHSDQPWIRHEALCPLLLFVKQPKQPCPLRQSWK